MKLLTTIKHIFARKSIHRNAQGMAEFALVMPLLLLVVYGLFEVGRLVFIYSNVITAAREAVRYGSASGIVHLKPQYMDCNGIKAAAQKVDFLNSIPDDGSTITLYFYQPDPTTASGLANIPTTITNCSGATVPTINPGGALKVALSGSFNPISAFVHLQPMTLISQGQRTILGVMHVEGGTAPAGGTTGTQAPTLRKDFSPSTIPVNGLSTIIFTINNPNGSTVLTGVAFSDYYPTGLVNANPLVTTNSCGGTLQASAGGNNISLSGASLAGYGECTLTVVVTAGSTGSYTNTSEPITSVQGGAGNAASSTLIVTSAFTCNGSKIVHGSIIRSDGAYDLFMYITNYSGQDLTINNIALTWNSDDGNKKNKGIDLTNIALGTYTQAVTSGNTGPEYSYTPSPSWMLPPGKSTITFTFNKTYNTFDATEHITMTFSTPGCESFTLDSDFVTPPDIAKAFSPNQISAGGTSTLLFTISNLNNKYISLSGVNFVDSFPSGMTRTGTVASLQCGGTVTSTSGSITLSGGAIPPESTCTVSVNVLVANAGTYTNTSGSVGSTNGGTGNTASAALVVGMLPPTFNYKSFNPSTIEVGGTSTLTLKITNPNSTSTLTGLAVSDTFPDKMLLASTPNITNSCGGTVTSTSGSISLADGSLAGGAWCKVTVQVTSNIPGSYPNTAGPVTSGNGGTGITKSATLTVGNILPVSISKSFAPDTMQVGDTSSLLINLYNPNNYTVLNGIAFTDIYAGGRANTLTNNCGGTASYTSNTIALSNGTLASGAWCQISIEVSFASAGTYTNNTGVVNSTNGGNGNSASASLKVYDILPPGMSKAFSPSTIQVGQSSTLIFTIGNPNVSSILTGIAFSDTYPAGLVNSTPSAVSGNCGGSVTAVAGGNSISFSGGSIPADGSCSVSVSVTTNTASSYPNASGNITSTNGGTGNKAYATLTVNNVQPPRFTNMSFSPNIVLINAPTTLSFVLNNPNGSVTLNGIAFSDTFSSGMTRVSAPAASQCGGTVSSTSTSITLTNGTLAPGAYCTVSVIVSENTAGNFNHSSGTVTSTNGGTGNTASASLLVTAAVCDGSTVTHGSIIYPSPTTMQMSIDNETGKDLTLSQVRVWWNYAYGHFLSVSQPRTPLALKQVQLGNVLLYGPSSAATSPLSISGNGNLLPAGTTTLTVTFLDTYDNHEYDAFTVTFTNTECSGFTLRAP